MIFVSSKIDSADAGAFVALVASIIVLFSLARPVGVGLSKSHLTFVERLLSVSPEDLAALRVNLLAVLGAYLGFVSLFISWGGPHDILYSYLFSTWGVSDGSSVNSIGWSVAAYLFAVGSLLSFYSPLASLLMACGDVQFLVTFFYLRSRVPNEVEVGIGLLIGILATAIVLISLFFPFGPACEDTRRRKRDKLLTWGYCT